MTRPEPLHLDPLAPYEDRLLAALAFFRFQRNGASQARHCLSMYLRQGEGRIMQEVRFYARQLGMEAEELIELIYHDSDRASQLLQQVFDPTGGGLMDAED
ncbi:hypothetical protein PN441_04300 [Spirulina major CS-329]|uniref:hypothetical protein n=1 Tax=Spirulina TaxID=1154 RepID=UPI002330A86B|nr:MULTISPECIES: hypothetical protein [Spirulina]MDB9493144.1 hypothetical protein [Spirulina subsalsa CS-330]MDB9502282.1 hypothetical protein [Spirulina major CS-329]